MDDEQLAEFEKRLRALEIDLSNRLTAIEGDVRNILALTKEFVTNSRFTPVQMLVYGLVSLIMTSVFAAVIAKVIAK